VETPAPLRTALLAAWRALLVALGLAVGACMPSRAATSDATSASVGTVQVFVREGCPYCTDAKQYLLRLATDRPQLRIVLRQVDSDPAARDELEALSREAGIWPPGVPTFEIGGRLLVGFDKEGSTAREIEAVLDGQAAATAKTPDTVESPWLGTLSASRLGLPLFTLAIGLLDGFNPCAMWVLLFLLSLLVRLEDRRRMALVAGTFVLVSGAVYYAFMAAWLNVFMAVGMTTPVRIGLALLAVVIGLLNVKDFVVPGRGPSLSIPASARPGLVARMDRVRKAEGLVAALVGVAVLALVVNVIELLCTAGLPALYTAVLAQQELGAAARHAYLGLYILGYVADDALMVATAVWALSRARLTERGGRILKLVSGGVMLALGAVLLLRPQWLS
jgi:glutaredoxin